MMDGTKVLRAILLTDAILHMVLLHDRDDNEPILMENEVETSVAIDVKPCCLPVTSCRWSIVQVQELKRIIK